MEELYKVMDDLLDLEFQIKAGMDILKELEELYTSDPEKEKSEAEKLAVLMRGYLQSMKSNLKDSIHYIDESTLEKAKNEKVQKQEYPSKVSKDVEEVLTKYCDEIFASGAETEEFFYRLGIKDGLRLKSTVKSVLEMMA